MTGVASYRLQLRDGFTFDEAIARLDHIAALGVSHLYLAPILTAAPGSSHGYDVTDPTEIDPVLGGREGFERLSEAARARGLEIILDIVPNHLDFGLNTPWLVEVLRHGRESEYGNVFDIDWDAGPLVLPWLSESLAEAHAAGKVSLDGDHLDVDGMKIPLAPGTAPETLDAESLEALQQAQHWRLLPWPMERDSITHRRFFTVTSLIGVRIEDEAVFERSHQLIFDLVDRGLIQGLRVDHVDGLKDPATYLERLAARLPGTPVWIEKIVVGDERLQDWPVLGTTGYESAALITRMLTEAPGFAQIDAAWRAETGRQGNFHAAVEAAKRQLLPGELAAELRQLIAMAQALADTEGRPVGPEMLREALTELLVAFPRYRSYLAAGSAASEEDRTLWHDTAEQAASHVRLPETIHWLVEKILGAESSEAQRLAARLQQVTGALIAKAHEDTAGFRFNRYLAVNEVGADPDRPAIDQAEVETFLTERLTRWQGALNLGSSHDTKRSEDARARLIAMTHAPEAALALWHDASALPGSDAIDANQRFYAFQSALALYGEPEAGERLAAHLVKALREAKEVSFWIAPDEAREQALGAWAVALLDSWDRAAPEALLKLCRIGAALSLRELGLRCLLPGMPDIYQGGEGPLFHVTDPDNRRPPLWDEPMPAGELAREWANAKLDLLKACLVLRRSDPDLFAQGQAIWHDGSGQKVFRRELEGRAIQLIFHPRETPIAAGEVLWSGGVEGLRLTLLRITG